MATNKSNSNYTVPLRRKREGKTNYKKRLGYLKSNLTRLVIRSTTKNFTVQLVNYSEEGDKVLATATSKSLAKYGWNYYGGNTSTGYLVGLLVAKLKTAEVTEKVIVDLGLLRAVPGSKIFAIVKGAVEGGLNIDIDDEHMPADDRINGSHIEAYAKGLDKEAYQKRFAKVLSAGAKPEEIVSTFEEVKNKILGA